MTKFTSSRNFQMIENIFLDWDGKKNFQLIQISSFPILFSSFFPFVDRWPSSTGMSLCAKSFDYIFVCGQRPKTYQTYLCLPTYDYKPNMPTYRTTRVYLPLRTKNAYLPIYIYLRTELHMPSYWTTFDLVPTYICLRTELHMPTYRPTYAYLPTYICLPTDLHMPSYQLHMPTYRPTYAFVPNYTCQHTDLPIFIK